MKVKYLIMLLVGLVLVVASISRSHAQPASIQTEGEPASVLPHLNQLTDAEKAAGWKLLFDGSTTSGWRNYKKSDVSKGWQINDGALCRIDETAGDLITLEQFDNFILELDYKVPANSNSGVMFRVQEDRLRAALSGVEFQILDNANPTGDPRKAGWAYALYESPLDPSTGKPLDATKPVGHWNHIKLVCDGPHIQHWMNGVRYCKYEIGNEDWNERVSQSKFAKLANFGENPRGHIALQGDHQNVCFANIKLLPLPAK